MTKKKHFYEKLFILFFIITSSQLWAQDTFSIVAVDPITGEVGAAGASCVDSSAGFPRGAAVISDIIVDNSGAILGAINTQASYVPANQTAARNRMLAGDTPEEIITAITQNDNGRQMRQYGIIDFRDGVNILTAGFTGTNTPVETDHIIGPNYVVLGNTLKLDGDPNGVNVLQDMERAFNNTEGSLADKLMAALQGAKRVGSDNRCAPDGKSSLSSFVRVIQPGETTPSLDIFSSQTRDFIDPIDVLQCQYDNLPGNNPFCKETITNYPYTMDFENIGWNIDQDACNVITQTNLNRPNIHWLRADGSTPSTGTGPTSANQGQYYMYTEASGGGSPSKIAITTSPCFDIPSNFQADTSFDYHMNGTQMGTLQLQANNNDGSGWTTIWEQTGNQGANWINTGAINLSTYAGSTVKLRFQGITGAGFESDIAVDNIIVNAIDPNACTNDTTYNGTWTNEAPTINSNTTIASDYNTTTVGASIDACTLIINEGVTVTISNGDYINVYNDVTVNGTLIIENTGSLVQIDEGATVTKGINGIIQVRKTTPTIEARNFMVMSSPLSNESRNSVYQNARAVFNVIPSNFVPYEIDFSVYPEFEFSENFLDDNLDYLLPITTDASLPTAGIGQFIFPSSTANDPVQSYDLTYSEGTLNSGTITVPINYNGPATTNNYNLLGNPYASAIDVTALINANSAINEVYYWDHITTPNSDLPGFGTSNFSMNDISVRNAMMGIAAINGGIAPGQFMASGQGFGIKADQSQMASNTPVVFTNSIRVTGNNNDLRFNETDVSTNKLWLQLTTTAFDEAIAQTAIGFTPNASQAYDRGYDSPRIGTFLSLFTILENEEQLAIQGRETFSPDIELTLGFSTTIETEESYTISINNLEGIDIENTPVYLIDHQTGNSINLKDTAYTFNATKGIQPNRFTVAFEEREVLQIDDRSFSEAINLYPNPSKDIVTLTYLGEERLIKLTVLDFSGRIIRKIDTVNFNKNIAIDLSDVATGMYFIEIESTTQKTTKRVIIQ